MPCHAMPHTNCTIAAVTICMMPIASAIANMCHWPSKRIKQKQQLHSQHSLHTLFCCSFLFLFSVCQRSDARPTIEDANSRNTMRMLRRVCRVGHAQMAAVVAAVLVLMVELLAAAICAITMWHPRKSIRQKAKHKQQQQALPPRGIFRNKDTKIQICIDTET